MPAIEKGVNDVDLNTWGKSEELLPLLKGQAAFPSPLSSGLTLRDKCWRWPC